MSISYPIISEIAYRTYLINEFGMATVFVLLGEERGLVIDTGCGAYDMREVVDRLCSLPYDVALSHGHGDHVAWCDKFADKDIWLHEADWPDYFDTARGKKMMESYPPMMEPHGTYRTYDIPMTCRYPEVMPQPKPLEDGHIFHLGGRDVEVIHTPGHTMGECVFLDKNTRILFSGDAINPNLGIRAASINTALKGVLKVKAREAEFDRNFNSHAGYGGETFAASMPDSCLDDVIYIMRGIMDGTADIVNKPNPYRPGSAPVTFVRYGSAVVTFNPDRIIDEGETPAE